MALIYSLRNRLSSDFEIKHIDILLFVVLFEEVHDGFVGGFLGGLFQHLHEFVLTRFAAEGEGLG